MGLPREGKRAIVRLINLISCCWGSFVTISAVRLELKGHLPISAVERGWKGGETWKERGRSRGGGRVLELSNKEVTRTHAHSKAQTKGDKT